VDTSLLSHRIHRRALSQLLAGGAFATSVLVSSGSTFARQAEGFTTLRVANEAEPTALDPWMRGYGQSLVTRQVYEPLADVRMTLDGEDVVIEYVPVLAESWEQVDELTTRFTIRQGVTFHNGEALDAHAIKASYDALNSTDAAADAGSFAILAATAGADVVDNFTIDITSPFPNGEIIGQVLSLGLVALPPTLLEEQGLEGFAENPVGTGPYQFSSWERGQQIVLTGFADYWNAANVTIVPEAVIVTRPEAAVRAQSVTSGETDFAYNIGAEQASALATSVTGGGFQSSSIRLNNQIAPTNDLNVRLAINHAIDRQAIADSIFLGSARPRTVRLRPGPGSPVDPGRGPGRIRGRTGLRRGPYPRGRPARRDLQGVHRRHRPGSEADQARTGPVQRTRRPAIRTAASPVHGNHQQRQLR
jgi:peptide/nickel transport system substrate-binding protein